jgi:tRNA(Arg) A34 adenosine deaminase TadA
VIDQTDLQFLERAVALAEHALNAGDEPFGSVLVSAQGNVLFEDRNRVAGGDHTQHPEFAIARWAAQNLTLQERTESVVYTSGEHCPMCSAAHAWVGLGRIVYASSSEQLGAWLHELGVPPAPVNSLAINAVAPRLLAEGPVPEFAERIRGYHVILHTKSDFS